MKRIIVTRFSAMGDVAMVASVLKELQKQHMDTEIIIVSRKLFKSFFQNIPRVRFHVIDPKGRHDGLWGLFRLYNELKQYNPDYIADLHNNIRSRILDIFFSLSGKKTQILDKGRNEKKALTRTQDKVKKQLKFTTERYADVFRALGFNLILDHKLKKEHRLIPNGLLKSLASDRKKIGIAPFAQHSSKVFPIQKMEEVVRYLSLHEYEVYIFGGGNQEKTIADQWATSYPYVMNTIGTYTLDQELDIISHLDLMISMDSSGMHMASLVGTRCISIWGATHPFAGFLGYGQALEDCIQVEHPNRPSSVYGNKNCDCDGIEAIDLVTPEMIIEKIDSICE